MQLVYLHKLRFSTLCHIRAGRDRYTVLDSRAGLVHNWPGKSGAGVLGTQSSPRRSQTRTRIMFLTLVCLISAAAAYPASVLYDRRQDGDLNVSADVQNIVVLVAIPDKMSVPLDLLDLLKSNKGQTRHSEAQERADHVMEAFVEPNTPYQVEIGSDRSAEGGGRAVEVVIAGRRRLETDAPEDNDEIKLLGAREQCGPDRERDPVTFMCQFKKLVNEDVKPLAENANVIQQEPAKESLDVADQKEKKPQVTPEVISS